MTEKSSTNALDQIRAEMDAATPGPWVARHAPNGWHVEQGGRDAQYDQPFKNIYLGYDGAADATLIAHAPTYLAALLDVAEAAQDVYPYCPESVKHLVWNSDGTRQQTQCDLCDALAKLNDLLPQIGAE